jgi:hypothetical protein
MTRLDPPQLAHPVMDVADAGALGRALIGATRHVLAGKDDAASLAVACVLGGGHLLATTPCRQTLLAQSLLPPSGSFRRIQGTPTCRPVTWSAR